MPKNPEAAPEAIATATVGARGMQFLCDGDEMP